LKTPIAWGAEYKVTVITTEPLACRLVGHGEIRQLIVGLEHLLDNTPESPPTDCTGNEKE
jgi:hypothetical protein